ncbi:AMP-binding enzyme [Rhodococcus sp. SJ-2]
MIRRRGENLSPAEVEEALLAHPDVDECAVVGVNAGQSEEEIKAYVRLVDGSDELPQELGLLHG